LQIDLLAPLEVAQVVCADAGRSVEVEGLGCDDSSALMSALSSSSLARKLI
jgi:hypothetical protein